MWPLVGFPAAWLVIALIIYFWEKFRDRIQGPDYMLGITSDFRVRRHEIRMTFPQALAWPAWGAVAVLYYVFIAEVVVAFIVGPILILLWMIRGVVDLFRPLF